MKTNANALWCLGQLAGLTGGAAIALKYGFAAGFVAGYTVLILVDIRHTLMLIAKEVGK